VACLTRSLKITRQSLGLLIKYAWSPFAFQEIRSSLSARASIMAKGCVRFWILAMVTGRFRPSERFVLASPVLLVRRNMAVHKNARLASLLSAPLFCTLSLAHWADQRTCRIAHYPDVLSQSSPIGGCPAQTSSEVRSIKLSALNSYHSRSESG